MASTNHTGRFLWHELHATDQKGAAAFYTRLFGWAASEQDMGPMGTYIVLRQGERDVGGIMTAQGGAPTHWLAYVGVESADGAIDRVKATGGKELVPPMDIPDVGRFTVLQDPQGAVIAALEPRGAGGGASADPRPGFFCWDDLMTSEPEAAIAFYSALYGWSFDRPAAGDPFGYYHLKRSDGQHGGGMMKSQPGQPVAWLSYVATADVASTVDKATGLGATVVVPPTDIPGTGRFAILADPTGGVFGLYQADARH